MLRARINKANIHKAFYAISFYFISFVSVVYDNDGVVMVAAVAYKLMQNLAQKN